MLGGERKCHYKLYLIFSSRQFKGPSAVISPSLQVRTWRPAAVQLPVQALRAGKQQESQALV